MPASKLDPREREARGENMTIWRAIQLAGGPTKVGAMFGLSAATPRNWCRSGSVPSQYISRLCEAGGNVITVDQVLKACEERTETSA